MAIQSGGTIQIPIQATITGYEKSLEALRKGLQNIDVSKGIGASLNKAFTAAEKRVQQLAATPVRVVRTDAQIDKVFSDLQNVGDMIANIGDKMQSLGVSNLNLDLFKGDLEAINGQIETLKSTLAAVQAPAAFQEAIASSKFLSTALEKAGADMQNLTKEDAQLAITKKLDEAKKGAEEAQKALDALRQKQQELANFSDAGKVDTVKQGVQNIQTGAQQEIQDRRRQAIIDTFNSMKLYNLKGDLGKQFGKENREKMASEWSLLSDSEVAKKFRELQEGPLKEVLNGQNPDAIVKGRTIQKMDPDTLLSTFYGIDKEVWQAALQKIIEYGQQMGTDATKTLNGEPSQKVKKGLDSESTPAQARAAVMQSGNNIINQTERNHNEFVKVSERTDQAEKQLTNARTQEKVYGKADQEVQKIVNEQTQMINNLDTRISNLESGRNNYLNGKLNETHQAGQKGKEDAGQAYEDGAKKVAMYKDELARAKDAEQAVGKVQGFLQRWFSIYGVVRMVSKTIRSMINTIKELDKTITNISIVTNMSSSDLWAQMPKYTAMANEFAVSISGVYQVSQLYYQQGLKTAEVMQLTEATLKMARIAGMGYTEATNFMTNAVRSFKMEMSDATHVTDVYSAISAKSATSTSELANAMSKTASSAEAVGSSFENTTAMIAVMVEATREAPQNIGSALKSIISRYGELKTNPQALVDSEGEELSLNKVDTALKTVGISIKDAEGQFREFDDVIMDLASKWDTIDKNTQRYIATIMAGNRQQSRFLALVSSYDRLKELSSEAANAEDASQLQYLKTLDSIEAKTTQLKTSLQSLYTDSGMEEMYKGLLDTVRQLITSFTSLPKLFGLPIPALGKFAMGFMTVAKIAGVAFNLIKSHYAQIAQEITNRRQQGALQRNVIAEGEAENEKANQNEVLLNQSTTEQGRTAFRRNGMQERGAIAGQERAQEQSGATTRGSMKMTKLGMGASMIGMGLSMASDMIESKQDGSTAAKIKGGLSVVGGTLQGVGLGASFGVPGMIIGGAIGALTSLVQAIDLFEEDVEERAERLAQEAQEAKNKAIEQKNEYKTADSLIKKIKELETTRYESEEAAEEYQQAVDELVNQFPEMSKGFDAAGNALTDVTDAERILTEMRKKTAEATYEAAKKELESSKAKRDAITFDDIPKMSGYSSTVISQYEALTNAEDSLFTNLPKLEDSNKTLTNIVDAMINYLNYFSANERVTDDELDSVVSELQNIRDLNDDEMETSLINLTATWRENETSELYKTMVQLFSSDQYGDNFGKRLTELYTIIKDPTLYDSPEWQDAINQFRKILDETKDNPAMQPWREFWEKIYPIITQVFEQNEIIQANQAAFFNGEQNEIISKKLNKDITTANYYERSSGSVQAISALFSSTNDEWRQGEQLYDQYNGDFEKYKKAVINSYYDWYDSLTDEQEEALNKMFSDTSNYDYRDIEEALKTMGVIIDGVVEEALKARYENSQTIIKERIEDRFTSKGQSELLPIFGITDDSEKQITAAEETFLYQLADSIDSITEGVAEQLWNFVEDLTPDKRKATLNIFKNSDITSISGIYDILRELEGQEIATKGDNGLYDAVEDLIDNVVVNLPQELSNYANSLSKDIESLEKSLSNATKGMSLKEATSLANQLDISLTEFSLREGKFFLDNYDLIENHYLKEFEDYEKTMRAKFSELYFDKSDDTDGVLEGLIRNEDNTGLITKSYDKYKDLFKKANDLQAEINSLDKPEQMAENLNSLFNGTMEYADAVKLLQKDQYKQFFTDQKIDYNDYLMALKEWDNFADKDSTTFIKWLEDYYNNLFKATMDLSEEYVNQNVAKSYISRGDISGFVAKIFGENRLLDEKTQEQVITVIYDALFNGGSWEDLPKEIQNYAADITKSFGNTTQTIFTSIDNAVGKTATIKPANELEKTQYEKLVGEGTKSWIKKLADGSIQVILQTTQQINDWLGEKETNEFGLEYNEWLADLKKSYESANKLTTYGIVENGFKGDTVDIEAMGQFLSSIYDHEFTSAQSIQLAARAYGYAWNETTKQFERDAKLVQYGAKYWLALAKNSKDSSQRAQYLKMANSLQSSDLVKQRNAVSDVVKNYSSATVEQVNTFIDQFKDLTANQIDEIFDIQNDGSYKVNLEKLREYVPEFNDAIDESLSSLLDTYVSDLQSFAGSFSKGITKFADLEKFTKKYNQLFNTNKGIFELFKWDSDLNGFILQSFKDYRDTYTAYRAQLMNQYRGKNGQVDPDIQKQIDNFVGQQMMSAIIDPSILTAYAGGGNKQTKKTTERMVKTLQEAGAIEKGSDILNASLDVLASGGEAAVAMAQAIAKVGGITLSDEDIQKIATGYVSALTETMESISTLQQGSFVGTNEKINKLLENAGYDIDDNGFVKSTGDVVQAYKKFYDEIKNSNNASLEQINNAYLQILNYDAQGQTEALEALQNGASMTYEALSGMLTKMGMSLEVVANNLKEFGLKSLGAGKVRIIDWNTFARKLNLDFNSEEYASAFSTYTQSMIDLNKETEKNVLEQFRNAMNANVGDQINLAYLVAKYGEDFVKQMLLPEDGYYTFENGILQFTKDIGKKTAEFYKRLYSFAEEAGYSDAELAALKDELKTRLITNLTDGIKKGLEGSLSNKDMQQLIEVATFHGMSLEAADFRETENGLKLSIDKAIELYNKLKDIDTIASGIVLKELTKSLQENNEYYKNSVTLLSRIAELERLIELHDSNTSEARIKQYQEELELAKEIARTRSLEKDDAYDFMNQSLPDVYSNPLTARKSIVDAYTAWGKAWKNSTKYFDTSTGSWSKSKGMMDFTDFNNWVNMLNTMAAESGQKIWLAGVELDGKAEGAAELIQKGLATLGEVEGGAHVVNLGKLGIDFKTGVTTMKDNFTAGFKELADQNIAMLDNMIAFAKTLAAMEELGEVAGEDHKITFGDIILDDKNFTDGWKKFQATIETMVDNNPELQEQLKQIKVGDTNMYKLINLGIDDWQKLKEEGSKLELTALQAFYELSKNGEFTPENFWDKVKELLAGQGFTGEINIGSSKTPIKVGFGENGIVLEANEKGEYIVGDQKYTSFKAAEKAALLSQIDKENNGENLSGLWVDENIGYVNYTFGDGHKALVSIDDNNKITYEYNGFTGNSLDEVLQKAINFERKKAGKPNSNLTREQADKFSDEEIAIYLGYKIVPQFSSDITLNASQRRNLAGKTAEKLQEEWKKAEGDQEKQLEFKAKYGFALDESSITDTALEELLKNNGIEKKVLDVEVINNSEDETTKLILKVLDADGKEIEITFTINGDALEDYSWLFEPPEKEPKRPITADGQNYAALELEDEEEPSAGKPDKKNKRGTTVYSDISNIEFTYDSKTGQATINGVNAKEYKFPLEELKAKGTVTKDGITFTYNSDDNTITIKDSDGVNDQEFTIAVPPTLLASLDSIPEGWVLKYTGDDKVLSLSDGKGTEITFTLKDFQTVLANLTDVPPGWKICFDGKLDGWTLYDKDGKLKATFKATEFNRVVGLAPSIQDVPDGWRLTYSGDTDNYTLEYPKGGTVTFAADLYDAVINKLPNLNEGNFSDNWELTYDGATDDFCLTNEDGSLMAEFHADNYDAVIRQLNALDELNLENGLTLKYDGETDTFTLTDKEGHEVTFTAEAANYVLHFLDRDSGVGLTVQELDELLKQFGIDTKIIPLGFLDAHATVLRFISDVAQHLKDKNMQEARIKTILKQLGVSANKVLALGKDLTAEALIDQVKVDFENERETTGFTDEEIADVLAALDLTDKTSVPIGIFLAQVQISGLAADTIDKRRLKGISPDDLDKIKKAFNLLSNSITLGADYNAVVKIAKALAQRLNDGVELNLDTVLQELGIDLENKTLTINDVTVKVNYTEDWNNTGGGNPPALNPSENGPGNNGSGNASNGGNGKGGTGEDTTTVNPSSQDAATIRAAYQKLRTDFLGYRRINTIEAIMNLIDGITDDNKELKDEIKESLFQDGLDLLGSGDFRFPEQIFKALGDYKGSDKLVQYTKAMQQSQEGDYLNAAQAFWHLGTLRDSKNQYEKAIKAVSDKDAYTLAQTLLAEGDNDFAADIFTRLKDYQDSQVYLAYINAQQLFQNGKYEEAAQAFLKLGEFEDSLELYRQANQLATTSQTKTKGGEETIAGTADDTKSSPQWLILREQADQVTDLEEAKQLYLQAAQSAMESGELNEAIEIYGILTLQKYGTGTNIFAESQKDYIYGLKGRQLLKEGDFQGAIKQFRYSLDWDSLLVQLIESGQLSDDDRGLSGIRGYFGELLSDESPLYEYFKNLTVDWSSADIWDQVLNIAQNGNLDAKNILPQFIIKLLGLDEEVDLTNLQLTPVNSPSEDRTEIDPETRSLINNYFDTHKDDNEIEKWFNTSLDYETATPQEVQARTDLFKKFMENDDDIFTTLNNGLKSDTKEVRDASSALLEALWELASRLRQVEVPNPGQDGGAGEGGAGQAKGTAAAKGTLMGELGPELYVSDNRYHLVGQNGAEFVNLPDDAIVFNHLQTANLLRNGSTGRGKPVTNERKAVAFAKGSGPAHASASSLVSTLETLRSMWETLRNLNPSDLSKLGKGGGGGGGENSFLKELERWFNLLQAIAKLEKDITYEEKLRAKLQSEMVTNGSAIYASQKRSLEALNEQISKNQELAALQQARYDERRQELAQSAMFGQLFYYNENGQLNYRTNQINAGKYGTYENAIQFLNEIGMAQSNGAPKYTAQEQYDMLVAAFGKKVVEEYTAYNTSGQATKGVAERVQAFFDRADGWNEELKNLWEEYQNTQESVLEEEQKRNELLAEIRQNQISVENKVLEAIESRQQQEIDRAQKERDAFSKAAEAFVEGLNKALEKEKQMYENQQKSSELNKMRRQLAILQRSGGSQSQIRQLQEQINSSSQDMYFEAQQQQIDAIKEASDLQLEKMDKQIEIMNETLEYQKENGLLWTEVYQVMSGTPAEIQEFIMAYTPEYRSQSEVQLLESLNEIKSMVEQWVGYRENPPENPSTTNTHPTLEQMYDQWKNYWVTARQKFGDENISDTKLQERAQQAYYNTYEETGDWRLAAEAANTIFDPKGELEVARMQPQEQIPQQQTQGGNNTRTLTFNREGLDAAYRLYANEISGLIGDVSSDEILSAWRKIPSETVSWWSLHPTDRTVQNAILRYANIAVTSILKSRKKDEEAAKNDKSNNGTANPDNLDLSHDSFILPFVNKASSFDLHAAHAATQAAVAEQERLRQELLLEYQNSIAAAAQFGGKQSTPITNIVNINNPVVRDMEDVEVIKDTLQDHLLSIAKKTGAYMSVS